MNKDERIILTSFKYKKDTKKKIIKKIKYPRYIKTIVIIIIILFICILVYSNKKYEENLFDLVDKTKEEIKDKNDKGYQIILNSKQNQSDFCSNENNYINKEYENLTTIQNIKFLKKYKLTVYSKDVNDGMSESIRKKGYWEKKQSKNLVNAVKRYMKKHNIKNTNKVTILDIGGNIGWYTYLFGNLNYDVITFEALPINYYLLKKTFCLTKNKNITIINSALYSDEMNCTIYSNYLNTFSNGKLFCKNKFPNFHAKSREDIITIKLDTFIPYLLTKNVVLMKIDVEGVEGKVFEGGMDILTKVKIPFIFLEFSIRWLKENGNSPENLAKLFYDNGYKISLDNFKLSNALEYDKLVRKIKRERNQLELYIIRCEN